MSAKIVKAFPPNYAEINAAFNPPPNAVFAYGDTIYSPSSDTLSSDLVAHEKTHFVQQAAIGGPEAWWRRYIDEPQFRLEQEIEAYRVQYAYASAVGLARPQRRALLAHICKSLASGMYGRLVTKEQARALVTA